MDIIGKLHPLLLHLPIGVLLYATLHWIYARLFVVEEKRPNLFFPFALGAFTAILSAVSGWVLAKAGGYDESLLDWHKYLGIATAVLSLGLLYAYDKLRWSNGFGAFLLGFAALLSATGHYGGSLTHGVDFLTVTKSDELSAIDDLQEAHIFQDLVMPIIDRKCVSCHNPAKTKGDLLLHDLSGWEKGGKHGKILKAGFALESALIKRTLLPKEDEEHMPPRGKLQLTGAEQAFLTWWIDSMQHYNHLVKDLTATESVQDYLSEVQEQRSAKVARPSLAEVTRLREAGFRVSYLTPKKPWIEVELNQPAKVETSQLKKLKAVGACIRSLNLSGANLEQASLAPIASCTNLQLLNLSATTLPEDPLTFLAELEKLEVLNLHQTDVDGQVLTHIAKATELERLYLWGTRVQPAEIEQFETSQPDVEVIQGAEIDLFGTPKLVAPSISAEQDLFEDTLLVTIEPRAKRTATLYALSSWDRPDSFVMYRAPFLIEATTEVSARNELEGWETSDATTRTFAKSRYPAQQVSASVAASEKYPANGPSTVTDLKKGSSSFGDGKWLGYFGDDITYTLDLGQIQPVSAVTVGTLSDFRSYIHGPKAINVRTSIDGKSYSSFSEKNDFDIPVLSDAKVSNHLLAGAATNARYLQVEIKSQQINPASHSAPGATCWLFVDEVLVE